MNDLVLPCLSKGSLTNTQEILASLTIGTPDLGILRRPPLLTYGCLKLPDLIQSEGNEFKRHNKGMISDSIITQNKTGK